MRLYSPLPLPNICEIGPTAWLDGVQQAGFRAMYVPSELLNAPDDLINSLRIEAEKRDIILSEVGAWVNNSIHTIKEEAASGIAGCQKALALAEQIGAVCAVNSPGSRHLYHWSGPDPRNLTRDTFDEIVESVRKIVDAVNPKRTKYTLEAMPWIYPDSPESYLELLKAIDRKTVGVHLDIANMINCPSRIFDNTGFINHCFDLLGDKVIAMHAKELKYQEKLTFHIDEVIWGEGVIDLRTFLKRANALHPTLPVGLEHMPAEAFPPSIAHIRSVAKELAIEV